MWFSREWVRQRGTGSSDVSFTLKGPRQEIVSLGVFGLELDCVAEATDGERPQLLLESKESEIIPSVRVSRLQIERPAIKSLG